jgi:ABC-type Mn2+/Zn2+ transport system permease subunit
MLERRGRGLIEGRIGAAYVLAGACGLLLLAKNPLGEHGMLDLLKGEIIAVSNIDLAVTSGVFVAVVLTLFLLQKEFLLVSFDREMAVTMKKNVLLWDGLLFTLIGVTISVSVMSVGPLVAFGFLLLPPLIAYLFARTMRQFAIGASLTGGGAALLGFAISYKWDLPTGPTDVVLLGVILALAYTVKRALVLSRRRRV